MLIRFVENLRARVPRVVSKPIPHFRREAGWLDVGVDCRGWLKCRIQIGIRLAHPVSATAVLSSLSLIQASLIVRLGFDNSPVCVGDPFVLPR